MNASVPAFALLASLAAMPATAQQSFARFDIEARGGAGVGAYEDSGAGLELAPGPSFGVTGSYAFSRSVALYAGYHRTSFGCNDAFCRDEEITFTSSGFGSGIRYTPPLAWRPWLRAGLILDQLDISADRGTSDRALGFEAGVGLGFRLRPRLTLTPGISYRHFSASFQEAEGSSRVAAFTGDVGFRFSF